MICYKRYSFHEISSAEKSKDLHNMHNQANALWYSWHEVWVAIGCPLLSRPVRDGIKGGVSVSTYIPSLKGLYISLDLIGLFFGLQAR